MNTGVPYVSAKASDRSRASFSSSAIAASVVFCASVRVPLDGLVVVGAGVVSVGAGVESVGVGVVVVSVAVGVESVGVGVVVVSVGAGLTLDVVGAGPRLLGLVDIGAGDPDRRTFGEIAVGTPGFTGGSGALRTGVDEAGSVVIGVPA